MPVETTHHTDPRTSLQTNPRTSLQKSIHPEKPCTGSNLVEKIQRIYDENEQIMYEFLSRLDHLSREGRAFISLAPSLTKSQENIKTPTDSVKESLILLRKVVAAEVIL